MDGTAPDDGRSDWRSRLRALPVFPDAVPDPGLERSEDPLRLVACWIDDAVSAGLSAPHVAQLATASATGEPSVRTLLIKDIDADAIWFSSSATSPKGSDLADNPRAALTATWIPLGRQLRLRGDVSAPDPEVSAEDFRRRGLLARREMLAGDQSAPRGADASARIDAAGRRLAEQPDAVDPRWTAYRLVPDAVEFWASRPADAALRIRFVRDGSGWRRERLWT